MINMVALTGRLTYEPELMVTPQGTSVIRFQLAVDRNYVKSGDERQADFIDCVAWRGAAEFLAKYFHKGSLVGVEGNIQTHNYVDKNGNNRKATEVIANNISFCEGKKREDGYDADMPVKFTDEELPFNS